MAKNTLQNKKEFISEYTQTNEDSIVEVFYHHEKELVLMALLDTVQFQAYLHEKAEIAWMMKEAKK